jgi:hypothetical protein
MTLAKIGEAAVSALDVWYGSFAEVGEPLADVRFPLNSRHYSWRRSRQLCARSRQARCENEGAGQLSGRSFEAFWQHVKEKQPLGGRLICPIRKLHAKNAPIAFYDSGDWKCIVGLSSGPD